VALLEGVPVLLDPFLVSGGEPHLQLAPGAPVRCRCFRLGGDDVGDRGGGVDCGQTPLEYSLRMGGGVEPVEQFLLSFEFRFEQKKKCRAAEAGSVGG
jgi:hypothetical protein